MSRPYLARPCVRWGVAGLLLGLALVAYAQDGSPAAPTSDPLLDAARSLGLPGVLLFVGWRAASMFSAGIPVQLEISEKDWSRLEKLCNQKELP